MSNTTAIEWKVFRTLSSIEQSMLTKLGVKVRNKPNKKFKKNGKPINYHLKSYTVCYHAHCDLCESDTQQWFQLDPDPYAPGEALSSRPLNPMNYNRVLGRHEERNVAVCEYCRETLEEWDVEDLVDKVILLQRAYRGVLWRKD